MVSGEWSTKDHDEPIRITPGARSAWHSHDGGQTLYVTEGRGLVQVRGEQAVELSAGDVVS